jgi:putative N6-adenine-specific DNA methylase
MIGANIAPGMNREFLAQTWNNIPKKMWPAAVEEAKSKIRTDVELNIQGYDLDGDIVKAARQNARLAGVDQYIHFQQRPVNQLNHPKKYGFVITNPPYGERLEEKAAMPALYKEIGEAFARLDTWSFYVITSYEDAQKYIGRKAEKNRKIYNGMLKTYLYQFMGPKPPKKPIVKNDEV